MATSPVAGFISKIRSVFPIPIIRLWPERHARVRDGGMPITPTPPRLSSTTPTFPSIATQNGSASYYSLAQRLRKLLPPNLNVLGAGDVQFTETAPFSSGGSSDVWKASFEGRDVAVKSLRCYSSPDFDPAEVGIRFLREVWASNKLLHPNIVPLIGVLSTPNHSFALIYEMMGNVDLGRYLAQHPNVSRLKLLAEIARALKYMHSQDVVHGNVRMRNVLVDNNGVSRVGGLGSAFSLSLPASWSDVESDRLFYGIAPEIIYPDAFGFVHARPTKATDMFGFGMLAWEVLTGKPPFGKNVEAAVILSVFQNERPSRPAHPEVSDRVWNMIQKCWNEDPFNRMTAADVVDVLEAKL